MTQNSLQELKDIWEHWDNGIKQLFYSNYGDLSFLVDVDLVPTVEEYTTLLRCLKTQIDKAYSRTGNVPTYLKKLMCITGMSKQWVAARIKQKGDSKCIPWKNLRDLVLAHPDSLLKGGKGFLSGLLRTLLSIKGSSGYTEARRHHVREVDGNSLKSSRG
ncbi:hypothetical protein Godav_029483 [Gossypium davidsonii]|uniref:Uncharacterized protein n=1 Tax=Gossypium davidsonii TaxID=34287 RepID=A0A7J8TK84_GOSDV|nr:hypothetical protein [Gossypium davidsonii]